MNFIFHANGRGSVNVEHTCIDATVSLLLQCFAYRRLSVLIQIFTQLCEYVGTMEDYDNDGYVIDKGTEISVDPPTKYAFHFLYLSIYHNKDYSGALIIMRIS